MSSINLNVGTNIVEAFICEHDDPNTESKLSQVLFARWPKGAPDLNHAAFILSTLAKEYVRIAINENMIDDSQELLEAKCMGLFEKMFLEDYEADGEDELRDDLGVD